MRIRQTEELPVYETLGDVRELIVCRAKIGLGLNQRGRAEDVQPAVENLMWSYQAAQERGLPEAEQIAGILQQLLGDVPGEVE